MSAPSDYNVAAIVEIVERVAPQFVGDSRVEDFVADAVALHSAEQFGATGGRRYGLAMAFHAAHSLTVFPSDADEATEAASNPGPIVSRKGLTVSETRAAPAAAYGNDGLAADFASTIYGRRYLALTTPLAARFPRVVTT